MSKRFLLAGLSAAVIAIVATPATCARAPAPAVLASTNMEVLVFEVDNCAYCRLFRRDVLPQYLRSKRARVAPIRFVDARRADPGRYGLTAPLSMVPTVVVLQDGREQGRIVGYTGPEPFFHMISQILGPSR